jgi:hypothetical protein
METFLLKKYSENPDQYRQYIETFREQTFKEGNESLSYKKYDPDNPNIETWMVFNENNDLMSISAGEKSHYTNDPDIALRICRYHILKPYRRTHCGLMMGEDQIKWAREQGYQILYVTNDINNKALNDLYQRKRVMPLGTFKKWTEGEWYKTLQLEKKFLFKTGDMLQYVYSIRLFDPNFIWNPKSNYIVSYDHNGNIPT